MLQIYKLLTHLVSLSVFIFNIFFEFLIVFADSLRLFKLVFKFLQYLRELKIFLAFHDQLLLELLILRLNLLNNHIALLELFFNNF